MSAIIIDLDISLLFAAGFLSFWLLNRVYKNTKHYKKRIEQINKFKKVPDNLELVNLGSNYAFYGYNYEGLGVRAFNAALQPQYLLYDFMILKSLAQKCSPGCVIIISLPPAVFCFDGLSWQDEKYYLCLPWKYIPRYTRLKRIARNEFPLLFSPKDAQYLVRKIRPDVCSGSGEVHCEKEAAIRRDDWIRQFRLYGTTSDFFPADVVEQFDKTTAILYEMIYFCLEKGFRPVLVIPPVSGSLRKLLGQEFLRAALFDNIKKANTRNIPVLNYLGDEQFLHHSLYRNSDFLTIAGSRLFTQRVVGDLRKLNCLPPTV